MRNKHASPLALILSLALVGCASFPPPAVAAGIGVGSGVSAPPADLTGDLTPNSIVLEDGGVGDIRLSFDGAPTYGWARHGGGWGYFENTNLGLVITGDGINLAESNDEVEWRDGNGCTSAVAFFDGDSNTGVSQMSTSDTDRWALCAGGVAIAEPVEGGDDHLLIPDESGLKIGDGGTTIDSIYIATVTQDYGSISGEDNSTSSETLTGVAAGDACLVTPLSPHTGLVYTCKVSGADTVALRAINYTSGAIDPATSDFVLIGIGL